MTTKLTCGKTSGRAACRRDPTTVTPGARAAYARIVFKGEGDWSDWRDVRAGILCNTHASAYRRSWSGGYDIKKQPELPPVTLTDPAVADLLAALAAEDERRTKLAEAEAENQRRDRAERIAARNATEWDQLASEPKYAVETRERERWSQPPKRSWAVTHESVDPSRWLRAEIELDEDGDGPATLDLSTGSNLTAAQARALAIALTTAADEADRVNARKAAAR